MSLYTELRELQQGGCGICGSSGDLVVDHDHGSGFVRGLLCRGCNNAEGRHTCDELVSECPICLWRRTPAVSWLGRTERYNGAFGDAEGPWDLAFRCAMDTAAANADTARLSRARFLAAEVAS